MPSAKAKPASKPVSRWAAGCNARGKKRRNAVKLLNALADEVFLNTVPVKAPAARVEALVRVLDVHCQTGDLPGRLRAAVDLYLNNGGKFAAAVLPPRPQCVKKTLARKYGQTENAAERSAVC